MGDRKMLTLTIPLSRGKFAEIDYPENLTLDEFRLYKLQIEVVKEMARQNDAMAAEFIPEIPWTREPFIPEVPWSGIPAPYQPGDVVAVRDMRRDWLR